MSDLRSTIKDIQRQVGTTPDGIFGPLTAAAVMRELSAASGDPDPAQPATTLDARSESVIMTLDAKAQPKFREFLHRAKATAATLGCDYLLISGHRSWEEQDRLYDQGRTAPGAIVTNAKGGQSNHNFGIAADAGVFRAGDYLDGSKDKAARDLAAKVHRACSEHAEACGLEWGGSWTSMVDLPHYEVKTSLTIAQKRELYQRKGSVL